MGNIGEELPDRDDLPDGCCYRLFGIIGCSYYVYITAKDISWPKVLCLIELLDQESAELESETVAAKWLASLELETVVAKPLASVEDFLEQPSTHGIILEQPSTNGDIGEVVEEFSVKLDNLHAECKKIWPAWRTGLLRH